MFGIDETRNPCRVEQAPDNRRIDKDIGHTAGRLVDSPGSGALDRDADEDTCECVGVIAKRQILYTQLNDVDKHNAIQHPKYPAPTKNCPTNLARTVAEAYLVQEAYGDDDRQHFDKAKPVISVVQPQRQRHGNHQKKYGCGSQVIPEKLVPDEEERREGEHRPGVRPIDRDHCIAPLQDVIQIVPMKTRFEQVEGSTIQRLTDRVDQMRPLGNAADVPPRQPPNVGMLAPMRLHPLVGRRWHVTIIAGTDHDQAFGYARH